MRRLGGESSLLVIGHRAGKMKSEEWTGIAFFDGLQMAGKNKQKKMICRC